MTTYYVDSAAGSNTAPYDTWAKAATSLATIAAIDAAGDTVYVASTHSETLGTNPAYSWAGTSAAPVRIICADKTSGAPPTTGATGATIATSNGVALSLAAAGVAYFYGLTFSVGGGGATNANITPCSAAPCEFDTCNFVINNTGAGSLINIAVNGILCLFSNCTAKFGHALQGVSLAGFGASMTWAGGSIDAASAAISKLFVAVSAGSNVRVVGVDLSACSSSFNPVATTAANIVVDMIECKLPASWSGTPNGSTGGIGTRVSMYQCDSAGVTTTVNVGDAYGTITSNTTVVMTGGASDGTTQLSWQLASNSQTSLATPLKSEWRAVWVDTTVSKTLTWNYVADANIAAGQGAGTANAFQNNQVWVELLYLGSATSPLGSYASSAPSTPVAAASDNGSGSASWTTTGLTTPKTGVCSVTFTTGLKGPMLARICVGAASKTIYADPSPTLA